MSFSFSILSTKLKLLRCLFLSLAYKENNNSRDYKQQTLHDFVLVAWRKMQENKPGKAAHS